MEIIFSVSFFFFFYFFIGYFIINGDAASKSENEYKYIDIYYFKLEVFA